jgi:TRAP-type mannitol/chloroaromatic compound transport system permease small subunit
MDITNILILTASLVASVRITAYVSEKLSQELAKMLPFTLIAMILIGDRLFSIQGLASRILEIPTLFSDLPYYLLFIIIVELSMRLIDLLGRLFGKEDSED